METIKIEEGKIYSFKLISGEELVAKVKATEDTGYVIESPLGLGRGQQGPEYMPIMLTAEDNAEMLLAFAAIAITTKTGGGAEKAYRESVSGIKVPEKKILMS